MANATTHRAVAAAGSAAAWGLLLFALSGCRGPEATIHQLSGQTMGTTYNVTVVGKELTDDERLALADKLSGELDAVDRRMSTHRDDSEVSRFNRHSSTEAFKVSAQTFEVIAQALAISRLTGGAFDVTVAPLVEAWGFGAGESLQAPSEEALEELRRRVGFSRLLLDLDDLGLSKVDPEVRIDLSAIAKGFAVDRLAAALDGAGHNRYMVEVGGEVRTRGTNGAGQPWRIGVERPLEDRRAVQRIIPLTNRAIATSGDYRNYREQDGRRVSHIVDPRSGRPIEHRLASATVVHERCSMADALATALMVLGPDAATRLAEEEELEVLLLVREGEGFREWVSPGMAALLAEGGGSS